MRCAMDCIQYLNKFYEFDVQALTVALEDTTTNKGISIFDFVETAKQFQLNLVAMKGILLPKANPAIIYLHNKKGGHYLILESQSLFYVYLFDGYLGKRRVFKPWFYLFFSHLYILCYNVKKEVQNGS